MSNLSSRLAHWLPALLGVALVVRAGYLLDMPVLTGLDEPLTIVLLFSYITFMRHFQTSGMCLRCIASSPLDPETAVRRNRLFLRYAHLSRRGVVLMALTGLVLLVVGDTIAASSGGLTSSILPKLVRMPMDAMFYGVIWSMWSHHRLRPWCPWCRRWDEGGDPELIPDPDPAEKGTR